MCKLIEVIGVRIRSVWSLGGPAVRYPNTRGCRIPGGSTHQLAIANQQGNKWEPPDEMAGWVIVRHTSDGVGCKLFVCRYCHCVGLIPCFGLKLRKRERVEVTR